MKKLKIITTAITIFASLSLSAFATEKDVENKEMELNVSKDYSIKSVDLLEELDKIDNNRISIEEYMEEDKKLQNTQKKLNISKDDSIKSVNLLTELKRIYDSKTTTIKYVNLLDKIDENNESKITIEDFKETIKEKDKEIGDLKANNKQKDKEIAEFQNEYIKLELQKKELDEKFIQKEQNITKLNNKLKILADELEKEKRENEANKQEINNLKANNKQKDDFYDNLYGIIYQTNWEILNNVHKIIHEQMKREEFADLKDLKNLYEILINIFEIKYYTNDDEANDQFKNIDKYKKIFTHFKIGDEKEFMKEYKKITATILEALNNYNKSIPNLREPYYFVDSLISHFERSKK